MIWKVVVRRLSDVNYAQVNLRICNILRSQRSTVPAKDRVSFFDYPIIFTKEIAFVYTPACGQIAWDAGTPYPVPSAPAFLGLRRDIWHNLERMLRLVSRRSTLALSGCRRFLSESKTSMDGKGFWAWTTQKRPHWKECRVEAAVLFCVFGVTGSSSMYFVRPCLKHIGVEGTMMDGPWSYRILSVLILSPIYATILITLGTLSGRHNFFASMGYKILKRFLPSSMASKMRPTVCKDAASNVPPKWGPV